MGDPFPPVAALYSSLPSLPFFASQLFRMPKSTSPDTIMGSHSVGPVIGITLTVVGRCLLKTVARPVPKVFNKVPTGWVARFRILGRSDFGACALTSIDP